MGLKPAQGELNTALAPLFRHIKDVHLIHDDLVIATATERQHENALRLVMQAISDAGCNPKTTFKIRYWSKRN